jgi:hypothetical protein
VVNGLLGLLVDPHQLESESLSLFLLLFLEFGEGFLKTSEFTGKEKELGTHEEE